MTLLQLRHEWSRKVAKLLKGKPQFTDDELAAELWVRQDEMEDFINFILEYRDQHGL